MLWVLITSALVMSTHNICFRAEIRKIHSRYFLSGAMDKALFFSTKKQTCKILKIKNGEILGKKKVRSLFLH